MQVPVTTGLEKCTHGDRFPEMVTLGVEITDNGSECADGGSNNDSIGSGATGGTTSSEIGSPSRRLH